MKGFITPSVPFAERQIIDMEISKKTREALIEAGWFEGRKIDISDIVAKLERNGFEVFDAAKNFYEEFGELVIVSKVTTPSGRVLTETCSTEIRSSLDYLTPERNNLDFYLYEKTLFVGDIGFGELNLYISESGKIFTSMGLEGENGVEAIDNIVCRRNAVLWEEYYEREHIIPYWERNENEK